MSTSLAVYIQISCFFIHNAVPQYEYGNHYQQDADDYQSNNDMVYDDEVDYRRSRHRKKHRARSSRDPCRYDSCETEESLECKCTCKKSCRKPKPKICCKEFCETRCFTTDGREVPKGSSHNQMPGQGLVFLPYPYPMVVLPGGNTQKTEPSTTTTTPKTTTPRALKLKLDSSEIPAIIEKYNRYNAGSAAQDSGKLTVINSMRRTKPNWSKYGIVPIPDELAESLMMQMRTMKLLQARRNTMRISDKLRRM